MTNLVKNMIWSSSQRINGNKNHIIWMMYIITIVLIYLCFWLIANEEIMFAQKRIERNKSFNCESINNDKSMKFSRTHPEVSIIMYIKKKERE